MAQAARVFPFRRKVCARDAERQALLDGMAETRRKINDAYSGFNNAHDPDLIESYVYEINALQSRYSYLLRCVRAMETPAAGQ